MVAFSLRTRDPAVARRLGMRLNLMSHEWSEKMDQGMLLPANIEQLMRGYAEREDYLRLERFRVDMEAPVPAQFASKEALFRERATQDRIFARLYQIAREEGPICQFSDALAAKLAIEGFSTFERDKICQRIENGYVRSLLEPKETGIGMPPISLVDDVLQSTASPVTQETRENVLKLFAGTQSKTLTKYANLNLLAAQDPEQAWKAAPRGKRPQLHDAGPPAAFACADAVQRGNMAGKVLLTIADVSGGAACVGACDSLIVADAPAQVPMGNLGLQAKASAGWSSPTFPILCRANEIRVSFGLQTYRAQNYSDEPMALPAEEPVSLAAHFNDRCLEGKHVAPQDDGISEDAGSGETPTDKIETLDVLIGQLVETKAGAWTKKTAGQHRLAGRILALVAGTNELARITQAHIGRYRVTLNRLPKNYGKSPSDATATMATLMERSARLKAEGRDKEVGLAPPTINRHLTQLGTILEYASSNGWAIGATSPSMRVHDPRDERDLRDAFEVEELRTLFRHNVWTGCRDERHRGEPGTEIFHDALYYVVILAVYSGARVSELLGLELNDVDAASNAIMIRPNKTRGLKTERSTRNIPLHPEVIRLRFFDYVSVVKSTGSHFLFPELAARGSNTPFQGLFDKIWVPVLDKALPAARENSKTFHSIRHSVNTQLSHANINDALRESLMGHSGSGVNTRSYLKKALAADLLPAVMALPIVTSHIVANDINLLSSVRR